MDEALLEASTVAAYLVDRGLLSPGDDPPVEELGGGVSNLVFAVDSAGGPLVVKQALPKLRVSDDWPAKRERILTEARAMEVAVAITPGRVPEVVDIDSDRLAISVRRAPAGWQDWKKTLLARRVDAAVALSLGEALGAWHSATVDPRYAEMFSDWEAFDQLRIDPYYRTVARRVPELSVAVMEYAGRLKKNSRCLVHGDYSPKNILIGKDATELWVIDFEVAHFGDPAFDLAFMLNHLMLKSIHLPSSIGSLMECGMAFWDGYCSSCEVVPEFNYVAGQIGCLMVARVDGKSPAEYLSEESREQAREAGAALIRDPSGDVKSAWSLL